MERKISMLGTLPPTKGSSGFTLALVEALSKKYKIDFYGFETLYPRLLYPGNTKTEEKEPKINGLNIYNYLKWYNPLSWIKTAFSIKTNILHAQWWAWTLAPIYLTILGIAKLRGKRIILTVHNVKPHEKFFLSNFLNNSVLGLADEYIVYSEANKKMFLEEIKTKKEISVITPGIIRIPKSDKTRQTLRKKCGFEENDKVVLFFGNIRPYKGLDILIKSLDSIKDKSVKLLIVGAVWGKFDRYSNIIKKLELENRIKLNLKFVQIDEVAEIFKISDLIVLPYKEFEAASGVATLALDFKLPMIVTNLGALPNTVTNKKLIIKPNNEEELTNSIEYVFKNYPKIKKEIGNNLKSFSSKAILTKMDQVYYKTDSKNPKKEI